MAKYLLTYHGELATFPDDPDERQAINDAWGAYYAAIGADLVDPGNPVAAHTAVGPDGVAGDPPHAGLTGFTIINAADADAAAKVARLCPVLNYGSSVQISELVDM